MSDLIAMEDYFNPGFKTKPAVHVGSQTMRLYQNSEQEQAIEGLHLAGASGNDVTVVRNIDTGYIDYWNKLIGKTKIINIQTNNRLQYLVSMILEYPDLIEEIKSSMQPQSKLMVYFPTELEEQLAKTLGIPLHGIPSISDRYGTKTGIRELADKAHLQMAEGYICHNAESTQLAINQLFEKYDELIVKHELSSAGRWMKKISKSDTQSVDALLHEIADGEFQEGRDAVVVEAWIKTSTTLCIHIEIIPDQEPIIAAGWQQLIDSDGVTYMGARPLELPQLTMNLLLAEAKKLASTLKDAGAIGSFGPDYMITAEDETHYPPGTPILIELNARVPFTAFPLEIVKQVKGKIGSGFLTQRISLPKNIPYPELEDILAAHGLLITEKDSHPRGIVPYNVGLLDWNSFYFVGMADTFDETKEVVEQVKHLFA